MRRSLWLALAATAALGLALAIVDDTPGDPVSPPAGSKARAERVRAQPPAPGMAATAPRAAIARPEAAADRAPSASGPADRPLPAEAAVRRDWRPPSAQALLAWGDAPAASAAAPPRPPPLPAAAPRPVEPATPSPLPTVPYRWIGRLDDGTGARALLSSPVRSVAPAVGETLDSVWQLVAVDGRGAELRHLPSGRLVQVRAGAGAAE